MQTNRTSVEVGTAAEWKQSAADLEAQIFDWSRGAGWDVKTLTEGVDEDADFADVVIESALDEHLYLKFHKARNGPANFVAQLRAWPTLYRVRLVRNEAAGGWLIRTDSGIPIRKPWGRETSLEVANDLLSTTRDDA